MLAVGSARVLGPTEPKALGRGRARVGRSRDLDFIRLLRANADQSVAGVTRPAGGPRNSFYEAEVNRAVTHDDNETPALHISHAIINTDAGGTRIAKDFQEVAAPHRPGHGVDHGVRPSQRAGRQDDQVLVNL